VNDTVIAGVKMKTKDVMSRLRGQKGTEVTVKVLRQKVPDLLEFKIVRDKIPMFSLDASYMVDKKTGYIKLNRFAATSFEEFKEALKKLQEQGMKNLIFDLQGNGGGYLGAAIDISNEFLKPGSLIVYTEGVRQKRENATAGNKGSFDQGKLVVLVDESSASASEIVSGAIQDWDRGVIVGRRTFGKGLVQRPIDLPDGSMIRLTTARYYTPTGRSIQKPYENGNLESYHKELIERYNKGEMVSADSIHFPDSLKYSTLINNRTVYGGGGIMPDYFVPIDTTHSSLLHSQLIRSGVLYKYTLNHVDGNRSVYKSKYPTFDTFNKQFVVSDGMLEDLLTLFKKENASLDEEDVMPGENEKENQTANDKLEVNKIADAKLSDLDKSKSLIQTQIKALIARELFGENQYYQVINTEIDAYLKAIEIINDAKEYDKLLGKK
jgi:carboxyl-terminal processing protease